MEQMKGAPFATPAEELRALRAEVARREQEMAPTDAASQEIARSILGDYAQAPAPEVLAPALRVPQEHVEKMMLQLAPEPHDVQMEELRKVLEDKGIKNALLVLERMQSPHLYDDFHRYLVEYLKEGHPAQGLREKGPLWRPLHMTLFEVLLPEVPKDDQAQEVKKLIAGMEQFYAGMLGVSEKGRDNYFTIEIANANGSDEVIFYVSVPDSKRALFEKQVQSLFHNVKVREAKDDYNIFNEKGVSLSSSAVSAKNPIFSLKQYDEFEVDPLNVLLHSFSKIDREGEGAAVQLVLRPSTHSYEERYAYALKQIQRGVPVRKAVDISFSVLGGVARSIRDVFSGEEERRRKRQKESKEPVKIDELAAESIKKKLGSPVLEANIRIVSSAGDVQSAEEILSDLEASFNQFASATGNSVRFKRSTGGKLLQALKRFTLRLFDATSLIPLSIKELTTMMHFPSTHLKSTPALRQAKAGSAPVPAGLPAEGLLLGVNRVRGQEARIYMAPEDRLRHFYTIGQTGTGKTTLLKQMIAQDIARGEGVCFIDPHGVDVQEVLSYVPPERYEDVIYFDPSDTSRPMALNMLEYDARFPEQKTFVVNEMLSIFDKLFDMKTAGGPIFEQYFRNAVLLTIEDPETGSTLLDVSRVLASKEFRELKLSHCKNPIVVQFWREVAEKAGGEAALQNVVPYITSKFDNFLANEIMRPIISQEKSAINLREIMDGKKILLVNLAKGRLGDLNANLIGLILVGKMLMAALSRVDSFGKDLPPFYLYIDEFQNVTTPSISSILSEARKYKLALIIAHQFIKQLDEKIKDAVFGNVGSQAIFRVGAEDAEFLAKQLEPVFTQQDLMNLDNRNAYLKLLVAGRPMKPFSFETLPPPAGKPDVIEKLKELSRLKFGRPKAEVEAEIMAKYRK
ncbi:MAG: type IV secretion system DNA-binding domain-containing protein [bacterium]|nr:type IV secretion system DNA-binding domain-containing protein [bacterium]